MFAWDIPGCELCLTSRFPHTCLPALRAQISLDLDSAVIIDVSITPAPQPVLRCAVHALHGAIVQTSGGTLWLYAAGGRLERAAGGSFPCSCPYMLPTPAATFTCGSNGRLANAHATPVWRPR